MTKTQNSSTELGRGTYGKVLKDESNPEIAIKTIHFVNTHSAIKEASVMKTLNHWNIMQMHKLEVDLKTHQINLHIECFETDMDNFRIKCGKSFIKKHLQTSVQQLVSAISYLHRNNVIHRDITPGNILTKLVDGQTLHLALCDFGLSIKHCNKFNIFDTTVSTPTYRAPEIHLGAGRLKYTDKSDIWSLGCVLYFFLSGEELLSFHEFRYRLFPFKRPEASLYLSSMFDLPLFSNHLTRLKSLKQLDYQVCKEIYNIKLKLAQVNKNVIANYLNIMADCLIINHNIRPSIKDLIEKYPIIRDEPRAPYPDRQGSFCTFVNFDKQKYTIDANYDYKDDVEYLHEVATESGVYDNGLKLYNEIVKLDSTKATEIYYIASFYMISVFMETAEDIVFEAHLLELMEPTKLTYVMFDVMDLIKWDIYSFVGNPGSPTTPPAVYMPLEH